MKTMNQERIKLIIRNMELLVNALKEEIKDPVIPNYEEVVSYYDENDVDEYYSEDDDV